MRKLQTETRECLECREEYQWNQRNIYCLCPNCRKRHYRKSQKLSEGEYKKPYPLNENEKRVRYRRIQKELDAAETREQRREIYGRELEFMVESGIWL
jgi:predicted  nucleic acid-binding Zn-ribbon protein